MSYSTIPALFQENQESPLGLLDWFREQPILHNQRSNDSVLQLRIDRKIAHTEKWTDDATVYFHRSMDCLMAFDGIEKPIF